MTLDTLDLNTQFNFEKTNISLNEEKINDCKILGRDFIKNRSALDYNWIGDKLNLVEEGIEAFNLSLLIGRKKDLEESKYILNKALSDFSQYVNIHSFDDLMGKYNFVYNRIKRFHIS